MLYDFRTSYSAQYVLINLVEDWREKLDKDFVVGAIFMDLSRGGGYLVYLVDGDVLFFRVSLLTVFSRTGYQKGRFSREGCQNGTFFLEQVIISATLLNFLTDFPEIFEDQLETVLTHSALLCIGSQEPDILCRFFLGQGIIFRGKF